MSGKILVIGSSNVDFIMKMDRLPRVGETITNAAFVQTFGGKGANQAVAAAKAGGEVCFVNCVGDDTFGVMVRENLLQAGVSHEHVFTADACATGTALVMIGDAGNNYLSVAPGANYRLVPAMLEPLSAQFSECDMVLLQNEVPAATVECALSMAQAAGKPVIFNFAPADPGADYLISGADLLVVNETEAESLTGFRVTTPADCQRAADRFLEKGVMIVLITLGEKGVFAASQKGLWSLSPAFSVEAVDTTAAGDVFCGSLAVALVEGRELDSAIRFANAASALCVTRLGAQPSIPNRKEIDAFLREQENQ